ncbi:MAG: pyruvate ferredoxin oxidoreductase [Candidatus Omnitrophota bacterium]|nr:MAG: pyruvate ferredoxin oxidoreductase [Candidatus Omnitrophota bacterium]
MKVFIEGSHAVAEAVKRCKPGVVCAYPITPQTHIVERLSEMVADGDLKAEFINVESEHSAASVVLGSTATGVRSYTATSSQGLMLMAEVLFNIAGMRLPVVLTCVNRSLSAPINIWNDHQDSMSLRDAGWIQLYAENNQEVHDLHFIAYRIAEEKNIMLPCMVCMDGYILSHGYEVVDLAEQEMVDKFLPPYQPEYKLDPENPLTLGLLGDPNYYMETRWAIQETMEEALALLPKIESEFSEIFKRQQPVLVEEYKTQDAEKILLALGSVAGTVKEVVDELREEGEKVGLLRIIAFRPFPKDQVFNALKNADKIGILDKSISLGSVSPVYMEISSLFQERGINKNISGFVAGLGGRDITPEVVKEIFKLLDEKPQAVRFVDLREWYSEKSPVYNWESVAQSTK